jgi:hypothetical protein
LNALSVENVIMRSAKRRAGRRPGAQVIHQHVHLLLCACGRGLVSRRVCKPDGTILILNHFSDSRLWWFLEQALHPLANRIGFRPNFCFKEQILKYDWDVQSAKKVNFLGLSTLVKIRNDKARTSSA